MFDLLEHHQVKELHVINDADSQLKAFIAIHDTHLGPALGGCRFIHYDTETQALQDVVKLAMGMSYKAALAGLNQGGGKAVILKPRGAYDHKALFHSFGSFVDNLNGRYITAIDSGTSAREMDAIAQVTSHVTSTSTAGNPSPYTAKGVFKGIQAALQHKTGSDNLSGIRVAIQGIGNVGYALGKMLSNAGAYVIVSDINVKVVEQALREFASESVSPELIHRVPCTVFSPCGLSCAINPQTVNELDCSIVAGSANVQLSNLSMGAALHDKGILYAPDYVINSGGLIFASLNHKHASISLVEQKIEGIRSTLAEIFIQSDLINRATSLVSDELAKSRLYHSVENAA